MPGWSAERSTAAAAVLMVALGVLTPVFAHQEVPSPFEPRAALEYSQAAIGRSVGDHLFLDVDREPVRLSDFRGRPLVVSLIFTACADTCPTIMQALYRSVRIGQDALGSDSFHVVTIGFDAVRDRPEQMRAYARSQGLDLPNWTFLSGDRSTIEALSAELGFIYFPSPRGFDHLTQTTVLDAEGTVYRHVYGDNFEPPALVDPLKGLVFGRSASVTSLEGLIDRVRFLCTVYDARTGRYRFDYSIFIGLAIGSLSLGGIGLVVGRAWLRERRRRRKPIHASGLR
jgi:protein SCO1